MRKPEEQLRALLAASSDAVYRMSPDWTEMRELDGRAFMEDTLTTSEDWRDRYIHPDDRAEVDAAIAQAIRTRTSFELEHRVVRADGTLGWTFSRAVPMFGEQGEIEEWIGMASDVTRRKEAEHKLRGSELRFRSQSERLELALRAGRMGTWELDLQTLELRSSDSCKANYGRTPRDAFSYQDLAESVLESDRERWRTVVQDAIGRGGEFEIEYPIRWPDGSRHWVHVRGRCTLEAGVPTAMSGVSFDISARQATEQALRESERNKDEFLATLAHELRNPLAPIRTGLAVLQLASREENKVLATMDRQLSHMVRMIDDLLDLSRISRGKVELRRAHVDVRTAIEHALEASRPTIDAGRHALTVSLPAEPLPIEADLTRLAQAIGNLLTNAAKYTPAGGQIALSAERASDHAVVRVRDNGVGIAPDQLVRVFEMFAQVGSSVGRSQGGLGIGLALARELVAMHGGTIAAESGGPGSGSVFTIRLPLELRGAPELPLEVAPELGAGRRILVVDDNVDAAEVLALLLSMRGHVTAVAHDGLHALELARGLRPEVVFLDLGLPGLSGHQVAQAFRADQLLRGARLVALTGWGSAEDRERSTAAGFDVHLTKPVGLDTIERTMSQLFPLDS